MASKRQNTSEEAYEEDAEQRENKRRKISGAPSCSEGFAPNGSDGRDFAQRDAEGVVSEAWKMTLAAEKSSDIAKLEDAIVLAQKAVDTYRDDPVLRSSALDCLSRAHSIMFKETGRVEHVGKGVEASEEAVNICPPSHPHRPTRLSGLAHILHIRFQISANTNDLGRSIALLEQVLAIRPLSHRSLDLHNLAALLRVRFQATANLADLDRSIVLKEESLELASPSDRPRRLWSLAVSLGTRFDHTANFSDLERGVTLLEQALILAQSTEHRRDCLSSLAWSLWTRYGETRNVADLERSITLSEEVLQFCGPTHIDRSHYLANLASSLWSRFHVKKNITDLNRAIELEEEALTLTPPNHMDRSYRLSNLAWSYDARFNSNENLDDLDKCVTLHEQALTLCPTTHNDRHLRLIGLAESLRKRFEHTFDTADLDRAIELAQSALESLPLHHPRRSDCLNTLSLAQLEHIWEVADEDSNHDCAFLTLSTEDAISQLRNASNALHSPSYHRLGATLSWVDASTHFHHQSRFEAYTTMFDILDTLVTRGHSLESRYSQLTTDSWITRAKRRIADAVSFAIAENRPRDAVVFLERGRALLLAQVGHCRMPLDIVRTRDAQLAAELKSVGQQLDRLLASNTKSTDFTINSVADDPIAQSMRLTSRWNALVERARELDGCRDFLRPTPFHTLQHGAYGGPVIFVNINHPLSHAVIVVHEGDPLIVPLPRATPQAVQDLTAAFHNARHQHASNFYSALRTLWDIIVGPVVNRLIFLFGARSRIWWCPSAAIAQLPLHAAGHYNRSAPLHRRLPHLFVSSYTSTLGALRHARRGISHMALPVPNVMVISQPTTQGEAELNVRTEIEYICRNLHHRTVLEGRDGTPDAVISHVPKHTWAHFSCHGYPGHDNPLRSYFPLHGGHLEVLDILRTQTPDAELAVLTACHTAHVDPRSPDEFLHLAGAMQFAGFRSVVGTLWEMDDEDGTFVVMEFYRRMFEELKQENRWTYTCAAKALNETVHKLRSERNVPPWRWVNYVHYGA